MPVRGNTFKIFIGNLSDRTTNDDLRQIFQPHGTVVEADAVKNYGFVHMQEATEGKAAIEALNGTTLHGKVIAVEASTGAKKGTNQRTKIFIGNIQKDTKVAELKGLFEPYGIVIEADILTNYAFLHMEDEGHAQEAIRNLDGFELNGLRIRVQESTSRVRQQAGMGNPDMCYRCGSAGHWSKECPRDTRYNQRYDRGGERGGGGGRGYSSRFDPYHLPPPPAYGRERGMRYPREELSFDHQQYNRGYERFYEDTSYDRSYNRPPPPPMAEDLYPRRMHPLAPGPPPPRTDYLRYGRRSPQPRYPPPPPMISSFGGPPRESRPF